MTERQRTGAVKDRHERDEATARGREERHSESGWNEDELKKSVRKEAQWVAEGGCTAQRRGIRNQICKKQSDVCGVKCIGTEALSCLTCS